MATLSDSQIAGFASGAGFSGNALITAIAVALAESGGDPSAKGFNQSANGAVTSVDRGLWQINSVYHAEVSDSCAYSPSCAAAAAFRISSSGRDFTPWTTYTSGRYRTFTGRAQAAAASSGAGASAPALPPTPPGGAAGAVTDVELAMRQAQALSAPTTLTLGADSSASGFWGPYQMLLAISLLFGFLWLLARSAAGYVAIYYAQALILLFLFATQAPRLREALLPLLSQQQHETGGSTATQGSITL